MNERVMITFAPISEAFYRWIDTVGELAAGLLGRIISPTTVRLVEEGDSEFVLQRGKDGAAANFLPDRIRIFEGKVDQNSSAIPGPPLSGSHIEVVLRSDRFLFRPLELASRAKEFMPGIVRSQIDRLTTWNATDAAFGWSKPVETDAEKLVVTVAATAFALIKPYVQAIADVGAHSIAVFTDLPEAQPNASPIKVWEQSGRSARDIGRIRQMLTRVLGVACIITAIALITEVIMGPNLTAQQDDLARQISARSALGVTGSLGAQRTLERRKQDTPSTVVVFEALSKILPDQTYLTELQLEGNKLRLTGITRDAPSLIGLIEQSGRFTRASFFAPTTRSAANTGDRFHIEALVKSLGPAS